MPKRNCTKLVRQIKFFLLSYAVPFTEKKSQERSGEVEGNACAWLARVSYVERVPTCFIACWAEIGRVFGINSPSMAGLFDVGVICGNMAANRRYRMTSRRKKKFGTKARGVGFYPSVLRRSATEETVGKSNLGFTPSLRVLCPVSAATATRSKTAKLALITFREIKKKDRGYALGCEDWILMHRTGKKARKPQTLILDHGTTHYCS